MESAPPLPRRVQRKVADIVRADADKWRRLMLNRAVKMVRDLDLAEDLVSAAFCDVLTIDREWDGDETDMIGYLTTIMRHDFLNWKAALGGQSLVTDPRRLSLDAPVTEDGAPLSEWLSQASVGPTQIRYVELVEVLKAIDGLCDIEADVITLTALGHSGPEIVEATGRSPEIVYQALSNARHTLRARFGRGVARREWRALRSRKDPSYRGVRLDGNEWVAELAVAHGRPLALGVFDDPEEAAMAHDVAAVYYLGRRAILNFPLFFDDVSREAA